MFASLQEYALDFLQISGIFGPFLFIFLHLIRPFTFLPVVLLCVMGGLIFGLVHGIIYSLIGLTLSSLLFYKIIEMLPNSFQRLFNIKQKLFGKYHRFSLKQITMLRLIPFIHFHLLTLCLYETTSSFKSFFNSSFVSNLPIALLYTSLGELFLHLSVIESIICFIIVCSIFFLFRKKMQTIDWNTFFKNKRTTASE